MNVKIIAIPPGQAPEAVRKEWVGLVIPLPEQESGGFQMGVLGGKAQHLDGYQVDTIEALTLLREKAPEAAGWFEENAMLGDRFVFARNVCELVK